MPREASLRDVVKLKNISYEMSKVQIRDFLAQHGFRLSATMPTPREAGARVLAAGGSLSLNSSEAGGAEMTEGLETPKSLEDLPRYAQAVGCDKHAALCDNVFLGSKIDQGKAFGRANGSFARSVALPRSRKARSSSWGCAVLPLARAQNRSPLEVDSVCSLPRRTALRSQVSSG
jgi:hypothetical protein